MNQAHAQTRTAVWKTLGRQLYPILFMQGDSCVRADNLTWTVRCYIIVSVDGACYRVSRLCRQRFDKCNQLSTATVIAPSVRACLSSRIPTRCLK